MNRKRKGSAAVEFAIVAPLFFQLILGMIESGRLMQVQQIITSASRKGAREAVRRNSEHGLAEHVVAETLREQGIDTFLFQSSDPNYTQIPQGEPISVTVSVPFKNVAYFPPILYKGSLAATTTMRKE